MRDLCAKAHLGLGVQKVVRRSGFNPEQEVQYRVADCRLACFIGADDQVKVTRCMWHRDREGGEFSVAGKFKVVDTHVGSARFDKVGDQARNDGGNHGAEFAGANGLEFRQEIRKLVWRAVNQVAKIFR